MHRFLQIHFPIVLALTGSLVVAPATAAYGQRSAHLVIHHRKKTRATGTLLDGGHYTNSRGHSVHSPSRTSDHRAPAGATAECRDGTFSFSESHRGTCSRHGGVRRWL